MTKNTPVLVDTILEIRAVGSLQDMVEELKLEDGKPISELLDEQKKETAEQSKRE